MGKRRPRVPAATKRRAGIHDLRSGHVIMVVSAFPGASAFMGPGLKPGREGGA